jgi:hypothetical protein
MMGPFEMDYFVNLRKKKFYRYKDNNWDYDEYADYDIGDYGGYGKWGQQRPIPSDWQNVSDTVDPRYWANV